MKKKLIRRISFRISIFFSYVYNSQSVPEPDEFNSVNFDREKFIESQQQQPPPPSIDYSFIKPKLSFPFFPFWPVHLYYPPYLPVLHRKSFDIDEILDLSMHKNKRQRLSTDENTN